jgi:hypothetical protein
MARMDLRRARAPIALIMLLVLGVWASSAFADGVVSAVTTVVTDTVPTDTTATSPSTDTTGTTTSPTTDTTPTQTATAPVVTTTTPTATTPASVSSPAGASDTPATAGDPGAGSNTLAAASGGQTATPAAATASAASAIAKAKGTHKAKTHRAPSSGAPVLTPLPIKAPAGGIVSRARPRHAPASRSHAKTKRKRKAATTTTTTAPHSTVGPVHLAKAKVRKAAVSARANGGREAVPSSRQSPPSAHEHGGIGFETPRGRVSISPTGFHFGSAQRSIASVDGLVTAVLDTLAVLAALAALIGAAAVLSRIRRTRQAARGRARVAPANRRTRAELYAEARRQNLPGRSNMTKAELERALYPPLPVRERPVQRVPRFDALAWMRHLRGPLPRGGSRGGGR